MNDDVRWFLDRYAAEMPSRTHSRDTNDAGTPQLHPQFLAYVTDGEHGWAKSYRLQTDYCNHPTKQDPCPVCEGSGLRSLDRLEYRHPAKLALHKLSLREVPKGRPPFNVVLLCLAANDGDEGLTAQTLAMRWSYMWGRTKGLRWIQQALFHFRAAYIEDAPGRPLRPKSESQSIAEAA